MFCHPPPPSAAARAACAGKPIKLEYYAEDCVIDKEDWCKPVDKKWGCAYEYKKKGDSCRAASGPCDVADTCKSTCCYIYIHIHTHVHVAQLLGCVRSPLALAAAEAANLAQL
jgi:hypothetical protein